MLSTNFSIDDPSNFYDQSSACIEDRIFLESERRFKGLVVRLADHRDKSGVQQLFRKVFNRRLSDARFHWKYGHTACIGSVVTSPCGEAVLGFYGMSPRKIRSTGGVYSASQICDVMLDHSVRALHGLSLMQIMVDVALSNTISAEGASSVVLPKPKFAFGYPSLGNARLGQILGEYVAVTSMLDLTFYPIGSHVEIKVLDIEKVFSDNQAEISELSTRLATRLTGSWIVDRSAEYLFYRYIASPDTYTFWIGNSVLGEPIGLCVVRNYESHVELVDFLGDPLDFKNVVSALAKQVRNTVGKTLSGWVSQSLYEELNGFVASAKPVGKLCVSKRTDPKVTKDDYSIFACGGDAEFR